MASVMTVEGKLDQLEWLLVKEHLGLNEENARWLLELAKQQARRIEELESR